MWDCPEAGDDAGRAESLAKAGKKTCDRGITNEPSAHFCTSCKQDKYNPPDVRDIQTIEDYVKNQAAMVLRSTEQDIPSK